MNNSNNVKKNVRNIVGALIFVGVVIRVGSQIIKFHASGEKVHKMNLEILSTQRELENISIQRSVFDAEIDTIGSQIMKFHASGKKVPEELSARSSYLLVGSNSLDIRANNLIFNLIGAIRPLIIENKKESRNSQNAHTKSRKEYEEYRDNLGKYFGSALGLLQDAKYVNRSDDAAIMEVENTILALIGTLSTQITDFEGEAIWDEQLKRLDQLIINLKATDTALQIEKLRLKSLNISQMTTAIVSYISDGALEGVVDRVSKMRGDINSRGDLINALQNEQFKKSLPGAIEYNSFSRQQQIENIKDGHYPWGSDSITKQ